MNEQNDTPGRAAKQAAHSTGVGILAAVTWAAAAFHAASTACIVAASYFTAWISRMQYRLLNVFAEYGAAITTHDGEVPGDEAAGGAATNAPAAPTTEIEDAEFQEVRGSSYAEDARRDEDEKNGPRTIFGGRPPKGQA